METVLKAIADWIKGILTAGIMSNLSGLFDDVNTQVGNIAQQVGTKPSSFEPRVFAMIEALSRNVVLPIAGIILTFIACYELIEMITQHNNMAQFEPALIMRWIFKTAISVWLISNTFDIVMAVFDLTQKVVSDSSGIIAGNTRVNDIGLSMLQSSLMQMDVGPLFGLFLQSFFIGITILKKGGQLLIQNWKFQRGDIFFTRFDNAIGSEQSGNRPAVVLQNDVGNFYSPTLIVATLTSKAAKKYTQPTHCLLVNEFLSVPSIVQAEQIFTVDKSRVLKFLGHLTPEEMDRVDDAVRASLALNPTGSIQRLPPIIRSTAAYAPPEVVEGKPPLYPYTPIKSSFEDAGSVEDMMLYTELEAAVHAMIQRLEYSFTFNPSLLTIPKRKQQVAEILKEAETYIWRIKEEMRCA